jgi:hypothetical protein
MQACDFGECILHEFARLLFCTILLFFCVRVVGVLLACCVMCSKIPEYCFVCEVTEVHGKKGYVLVCFFFFFSLFFGGKKSCCGFEVFV